MNIETREFAIPRKVLFKILLRDRFKKSWWVFVVIFCFSVLAYEAGILSVILVLLTLWIGYLLLLLGFCYWHTKPKGNELYYSLRTCKVDHEAISTFYPDGSFSKIKFTLIKKILTGSGYYVLFLTKHHFIYLSKKAMLNPNDFQMFETLLKVKVS